MRRPTRRRATVATAVLTAATLFGSASCGLGTAGGFSPSGRLAGPDANVPNLDGAKISVGSKDFTEQLLLGKILVIMLQSAGAQVSDLTDIPGSASARQAQLAGQVDAEFEYTGTAWISYLGHSNPIPDEKKQYTAVRDEDLQKNQLVWLPPAPMNNTYAMATRSDTAAKLGVKSLEDLAKVPTAQRTFCVDSEFAARNDGFQPMLKAYGLTYGSDVRSNQVKTLASGAIYDAVDSGQCTFGEVFTTDGRIKRLDLAVMSDPKSFFPKYNAAVVLRKEVADTSPQIQQLMAPVVAKLDNQTMIDLNAKIDVDGKEPSEVAYEWLRQQGFIQ